MGRGSGEEGRERCVFLRPNPPLRIRCTGVPFSSCPGEPGARTRGVFERTSRQYTINVSAAIEKTKVFTGLFWMKIPNLICAGAAPVLQRRLASRILAHWIPTANPAAVGLRRSKKRGIGPGDLGMRPRLHWSRWVRDSECAPPGPPVPVPLGRVVPGAIKSLLQPPE